MKVTIVVTGASRGFGRSIAKEFCKGWNDQGHSLRFVLTARDESSLINLQHELEVDGAVATYITGNLDSAEGVDTLTEELLKQAFSEECDRFVLVNNAGTLGDINKFTDEYNDINTLQTFFMTNVTSMVYLTSRFLKHLKGIPKINSTIVNVSSLMAVQPEAGFGLYCSSRSARDMFTSVAAAETTQTSNMSLLSYAPGPLDTDMQGTIRNELVNTALRDTFRKMKDEGQLVDPRNSARRLFELLDRNDFRSGSHIDYYDEE
eukprot:gene8026-740_t